MAKKLAEKQTIELNDVTALNGMLESGAAAETALQERLKQVKKDPVPDVAVPVMQMSDSELKQKAQLKVAKDDLDTIKKLFFSHYPAYRPSFSDCQCCMACLYAVSVRGTLSPGQRKVLEGIKKRLVQKKIIKE